MPFDNPHGPPGEGPPDPPPDGSDSLMPEVRAAVDAAVAQMRKIAATASTEARINVASAIAMASATMLGVALLIVAWTFVVALGVWLAVDAGWPVPGALLAAALTNVVAAIMCRIWYARLSRNMGFARTIRLLFAGRRPHEHPR